jgi:hypothetical protein
MQPDVVLHTGPSPILPLVCWAEFAVWVHLGENLEVLCQDSLVDSYGEPFPTGFADHGLAFYLLTLRDEFAHLGVIKTDFF